MKTLLTILATTLVLGNGAFAQFSENFDQNITGLSSNCWTVNQFNYSTTSNDVINGTGSAYTNPPTSGSGERTLTTPFLDVTSNSLTVSFNYKISSKINGNATRTLNVGVVNSSGVFTSLELLTMDKNFPTTVQVWNSTYNIATLGEYRLEIRVGGATGDGNSRVIFDDLNISASAHYGPTVHCNTPATAVNDVFAYPSVATVSGNVLTNDQFPADGEVYTPSVVTAPVSGTLVLNADGTFEYTPAPTFTGGTITFTYQVSDNGYPSATSNIATVTLNFPAPVILPVMIREFDATMKGDVVVLSWIVDYNFEGKYYEIEKSVNGSTFEVIGTVMANDHSNKYSFNDTKFITDAYYRLKAYSTDGSKGYTKMVFVKSAADVQALNIKGTVVSDVLRISYGSSAKTVARIQVVSMNGASIISQTLNMEKGFNETAIDVQKLSAGVYAVAVNAGGKRETLKFIKR